MPNGTEFTIENEKTRVLAESYDNGDMLWRIILKNKNNIINAQFSLTESGQITIEDSESSVSAAFTYVNTGIKGRTAAILSEDVARTSVNVATWAAFRTAWNTPTRTQIKFTNTGRIQSSAARLNDRNTPVVITSDSHGTNVVNMNSHVLTNFSKTTVTNSNLVNFNYSGNSLELDSAPSLFAESIQINELIVNNSFNVNVASISVGTFSLSQSQVSITGRESARAQRLQLKNRYSLASIHPIPVISAPNISIQSNLMRWNIGSRLTGAPDTEWQLLSAEIVNNALVYSSDNTFTIDALNLSGTSKIASRGEGGVTPPAQYNLQIQASPASGGNPTAEATELNRGQSTIINANSNEGYRFIRWEVSGTGSVVEDTTASRTTFVMGSEDSVVCAIYEKKLIPPPNPVDPLCPEIEVNPENRPELPEEQGMLSIDFISSFNFGSQAISAHNKTYYAQTQRLLNEDGTVSEQEKRPNYVQISDRRSENERNG